MGWFAILRLHPELNLDATGQPVPLKRNHGLLHTVSSSGKSEIENSDLPSAVFQIYLSGKRGMNIDQEWTCVVDVKGILLVKQSDSKLVIRHNLLENSVVEAVPSESKPEPISSFLFDSRAVVSSGKLSSVRLVFHDVVSTKVPIVLEGKKSKADDIPPFEVTTSYRFVIVDIIQSDTQNQNEGDLETMPVWSISRRLEISIDRLGEATVEVGRVAHNASADLSPDGRFLLIFSSGLEGGIKFFKLPDLSIGGLPLPTQAENHAQINHSAVESSLEPQLLFQLDQSNKLLNQGRVFKAFILPPSLIVDSSSLSNDSTNARENLPDICLVLTSSSVVVLGLRSNPLPPPVELSHEEAKKKKDKDKESPPPHAGSSLPVCCYLAARWSLTTVPSCASICLARRLLGVGLRDGSVCFWRLDDRLALGTAAKHTQGPVTSLLIMSEQESGTKTLESITLGVAGTGQGYGDLIVVSAAMDGSICVFSPPSNSTSALPSSSSSVLGESLRLGGDRRQGAAVAGDRTVAPQLCDFRFDIPGSAVFALFPLPTPWSDQGRKPNTSLRRPKGFFAQYSCGTVAAYEWRPAAPAAVLDPVVGGSLGSVFLKGVISNTERDPNFPLSKLKFTVLTTQLILQRQKNTLNNERNMLADATQLGTLSPRAAGNDNGNSSLPSPSRHVAPSTVDPPSSPKHTLGESESQLWPSLKEEDVPLQRFFASVSGLRTLHLYNVLFDSSSEDKEGVPILSSYPLSSFGGVFEMGIEGKESDEWTDPFLAGGRAVRVTKESVHSAVSFSSSFKPVTKARLAALQQSQSDAASKKSVQLEETKRRERSGGNGIVQPLLPAKTVLKDVLNSKLERNSRKNKLVNNLKDLLTYM